MPIGYKKTSNLKHQVPTMIAANLERKNLIETHQERDLGIYITSDLKWKTQCMKAAGKANSVLRQLKHCFKSWTIQTFKLLYTTFVRPHLKYAVSAWNPHLKSDIKILEQVQRRATKMVREIRHLSYEERLLANNLTTLENRRIRGSLIDYYKIEKGYNIVDWHNPNTLTNSINIEGPAKSIRGTNHRLIRQNTMCAIRNNVLSNSVIPHWNKFTKEIINAPTINSLKSRLDKFNKAINR